MIVDIEAETVQAHKLAEGLCPGQVVWTPDSKGLIGMALVSPPFRLGLIYCRNRNSFLFHMDLQGNYSKLN